MNKRSLILVVIASICLQLVVGRNFELSGEKSAKVVVGVQRLTLNVSTGYIFDYEDWGEYKFNVRVGGCIVYVRGYIWQNKGFWAELTYKYLRALADSPDFKGTTPMPLRGVRFDITNYGGGQRITNVTSISKIVASPYKVTYFGKDSNDNGFEQNFICRPKFESDGDKGAFTVLVTLDGKVPRNFKLESASQLYVKPTPKPTPTPTDSSNTSLIIAICAPIAALPLISMISSSIGGVFWCTKQKGKSSAKQVTPDKPVSVEFAVKPKLSPPKDLKKASKNHNDRDIESQKDNKRNKRADRSKHKDEKTRDVSVSQKQTSDESTHAPDDNFTSAHIFTQFKRV